MRRAHVIVGPQPGTDMYNTRASTGEECDTRSYRAKAIIIREKATEDTTCLSKAEKRG